MSLLFAICGKKDNLLAKEVPLNEEAQTAVKSTFLGQAEDFREENEIPYDPNWNQDETEIMTIQVPQDTRVFKQILETNETGFEPIDTNNFDSEDIRALAVKDHESILVQRFRVAQSLTKNKLALLLHMGTFTHLRDTAFHLDHELLCIIEDGLIKFKNFHKLGRIINTSTIFRVATDSEVREFLENNSDLFHVPDINNVVKTVNRNTRKYIKSIVDNRILEQRNVRAISREANKTNLDVRVKGGKIVLPERSDEITELMRFLNEGRYLGPISGQPYITNSRRPAKN